LERLQDAKFGKLQTMALGSYILRPLRENTLKMVNNPVNI